MTRHRRSNRDLLEQAVCILERMESHNMSEQPSRLDLAVDRLTTIVTEQRTEIADLKTKIQDAAGSGDLDQSIADDWLQNVERLETLAADGEQAVPEVTAEAPVEEAPVEVPVDEVPVDGAVEEFPTDGDVPTPPAGFDDGTTRA